LTAINFLAPCPEGRIALSILLLLVLPRIRSSPGHQLSTSFHGCFRTRTKTSRGRFP